MKNEQFKGLNSLNIKWTLKLIVNPMFKVAAILCNLMKPLRKSKQLITMFYVLDYKMCAPVLSL